MLNCLIATPSLGTPLDGTILFVAVHVYIPSSSRITFSNTSTDVSDTTSPNGLVHVTSVDGGSPGMYWHVTFKESPSRICLSSKSDIVGGSEGDNGETHLTFTNYHTC